MSAMSASNDNIVSLDTVDKDEIDHISIGSNKNKKTVKSSRKTTTN